jgi:CubicO group peptidase (beta-lactamase class C family)
MDIHSFLVIRNGYLVSESYFGGYDADRGNNMQSAGRSFTGTLVGIALDKGSIDEIAHRVLDYFADRTFAHLDEQKKAITVEDVLTMRSGHQTRMTRYGSRAGTARMHHCWGMVRAMTEPAPRQGYAASQLGSKARCS